MPILNVKVSAKRSAELTEKISTLLMDLTSATLKKKRELTSIVITYIDPEDWIVGGKSLAVQRKSSVYFDIKITDETNTKTEKATYIKQAFKGFSLLLGDLHHESYIYVEDVRPTAYGYGGLTQEFRFHQC